MPRDKWLITIKPVRLLWSPWCVRTTRARNRSTDWQLPLPQDTSLLLVLVCADAYSCGGVSASYRSGSGRTSQSLPRLETNEVLTQLLFAPCLLCSLCARIVWYGGFCSDAWGFFWIEKYISARCPSMLLNTVVHSPLEIPQIKKWHMTSSMSPLNNSSQLRILCAEEPPRYCRHGRPSEIKEFGALTRLSVFHRSAG